MEARQFVCIHCTLLTFESEEELQEHLNEFHLILDGSYDDIATDDVADDVSLQDYDDEDPESFEVLNIVLNNYAARNQWALKLVSIYPFERKD